MNYSMLVEAARHRVVNKDESVYTDDEKKEIILEIIKSKRVAQSIGDVLRAENDSLIIDCEHTGNSTDGEASGEIMGEALGGADGTSHTLVIGADQDKKKQSRYLKAEDVGLDLADFRHSNSASKTSNRLRHANTRVSSKSDDIDLAYNMARIKNADKKDTSKPKKSQEVHKSNIEGWLNFSMNQQLEKDIEQYAIYRPYDICISYVCRYSQMTEKFIERLIALSVDVVCRYTTEEEIEALQQAMIEKITSKNPNKFHKTVTLTTCNKQSGFKPFTADFDVNKLQDRIDWTYISVYQILSDEFVLKYLNVLKPDLILNNQRLSDETVVKIKKILRARIDEKQKLKGDINAPYSDELGTFNLFDDLDDEDEDEDDGDMNLYF